MRLGKCSESNTWDVFWLTRKDNVLVSELIDGEPSMSKGVVESDLRPMDGRKNTLLKPKGLGVGRTSLSCADGEFETCHLLLCSEREG